MAISITDSTFRQLAFRPVESGAVLFIAHKRKRRSESPAEHLEPPFALVNLALFEKSVKRIAKNPAVSSSVEISSGAGKRFRSMLA